MTKKQVRVAVVGVGYLGQYHAEKYASLPDVELVAVCDIDGRRSQEIAERQQTQALTDYQSLVGKVDAVSIAVPTQYHYEVAAFFIKHGVHVLVEKPITVSLEEADELIALAQKHQVKLQVGHLERFNNAIKALKPQLNYPRFIESIRIAPFKPRSLDVNVVLDLMIHDIDLIQSFVNSDITNIAANGASVLSTHIDIANARIEFNNGAVANVTASRVSLKSSRLLRIFQPDCYISLDLEQKRLAVHKKGLAEMLPGIPQIINEEHTFEKGDALLEQIMAFIDAIRHDHEPLVTGLDGKKALATAIQITDIMRDYNIKHVGSDVGRIH